MARSLKKRGLAEGLMLPTIQAYEQNEPIEEAKPDKKEIQQQEQTVINDNHVIESEEDIEPKKEEPEEKQQSKRGRKPGSQNKPKQEIEDYQEKSEKKTDTTRIGLPVGWKRNSFVFNEENLELVKCFAFENRIKEKDVINQALNEFFERHPVKKR